MTDAVPQPTTIFHNPRCSKSRGALELIEAQGDPFTVIEYLQTPPDRATLEGILAMLHTPPVELVRTSDTVFRDLGIDAASLTTPASVVDLLVAHPEVMQRPVVIRQGRAVIARPAELVAQVLD